MTGPGDVSGHAGADVRAERAAGPQLRADEQPLSSAGGNAGAETGGRKAPGSALESRISCLLGGGRRVEAEPSHGPQSTR
jgi:hypothetical protein